MHACRPAAPGSVLTSRLFIAVAVPSIVRDRLDQTARRASTHWPPDAVRWTPSGNQHLTLRFLGDTTPERVPALVMAMDDIAAFVAPLELHLDRTGAFPANGPARVLWMGLRADAGYAALMPLQQRLECRVRDLGWEAETRPYQPHLTLGRVGAGRHRPSGDWHQTAPPGSGIAVKELLLMRSELHGSGARYSTVHAARLGGM